jgi:enterochelin esterase-like enzyme
VWLDTGESDRWRRETERVEAALRQGGAKVDLRLFKGRHEGAYWRAHLEEYVRFYAAALSAR